MSEPTSTSMNPGQPPIPPAQLPSQPPTIPPDVWAKIQEDARELKAQNFQTREQVIAWLQARGGEDMEKILQRVQAGEEI